MTVSNSWTMASGSYYDIKFTGRGIRIKDGYHRMSVVGTATVAPLIQVPIRNIPKSGRMVKTPNPVEYINMNTFRSIHIDINWYSDIYDHS